MRLPSTELRVPKFPSNSLTPPNLHPFKHLPPPLTRRHKKFHSSPFDFIHLYKPKKKKKSKKSWFDLINPFECESDYDDDDYSSEYSSGSSEFMRRKSKKQKSSKLKKKKKKILIKFVVAFLLIIIFKILLEKLWYLFPGIFPTTGRLELAPNEIDHLYDEAPAKGNDIELDIALERSLFAPGYDETRVTP